MQQQINDYIDYLRLVRGVADTTLHQKRTILLYFAKATNISDLEQLTNEVFASWIDYLRSKGINASSINIYNSIILTMVSFYQNSGASIPLNRALIQNIKTAKPQRKFYSETDINRVLKEADFETELMIRIMFETGMRISELVGLRLRNLDGRRISFVGKGKKAREVYVTQETFKLIKHYIYYYDIKDYLWGIYDGYLTRNGEPPTVNTVRNHLRDTFRLAGFDGFYPHALRHSFATDLQLRGASVAEIKEMMGHDNLATTEKYLHGFDGKLRELFDKYR